VTISRRAFLALAVGTAVPGSRRFVAWFARENPGSLRGREEGMDRIDRMTALFRRRWACPVLAELHRTEGAKFVTLVNRLESNPAALRETLDELLDLGWIRRNPGYGHPMRPEYLLTGTGERLAPTCLRLDAAFTKLGLQEVALRKWSMPILYVIGEGPTRFTEIPRVLEGVTDRAVSLTLKDLSEAALIARTLLEGPPPGSVYGATGTGGILLPILERV
jgi:DNA-binding HxlR family transcriptional regulator